VARFNGRRLRQLRESQGLSREDLAQMAGIKSGIIYKLEKEKNSNPKLKTLASIAKVLGVPVADLILED
jgi:transcriptional regulator with XRE-family HTH domain